MIEIHVRKPFIKSVSKIDLLSSLSLVISNLVPNEKIGIGIGILICSDKEIQQLNLKFRQIDLPTDVLSFGFEEMNPEISERYLGDIIISFETAYKQSRLMAHSVMTEITILLIHGFLHLLGYDHDTDVKKRVMWQKQFEAINLLGIKATSFSGEND
jgi:probable rRNA maturation factor